MLKSRQQVCGDHGGILGLFNHFKLCCSTRLKGENPQYPYLSYSDISGPLFFDFIFSYQRIKPGPSYDVGSTNTCYSIQNDSFCYSEYLEVVNELSQLQRPCNLLRHPPSSLHSASLGPSGSVEPLEKSLELSRFITSSAAVFILGAEFIVISNSSASADTLFAVSSPTTSSAPASSILTLLPACVPSPYHLQSLQHLSLSLSLSIYIYMTLCAPSTHPYDHF